MGNESSSASNTVDVNEATSLTAARSAKGRAIRGVNLGGWLVVEKWMNQTIFREADDSINSEYALCAHLGARAQDVFKRHRDTWLTKQDFIDIKSAGLESVRLPFGFWCLDLDGLVRKPHIGDRGWIADGPGYVGPCEEYLEQALAWARETDLTVNLCLHGAPGGQSGHDHTGFSDPSWNVSMWDSSLTVRCLDHIAKRFGSDPALSGITVINEPDGGIDSSALAEFYCNAYNAIRQHSESVTILMPVYQRSWWWLRTYNSFPPKHWHSIAFDVHQYQCFGFPWQTHIGLKRTLEWAKTGFGHINSVSEIKNSGYAAVCSEWSLRLPEWDDSWPVARDLAACENRDEQYKIYASNQIHQYDAGLAWYFWTWKVDNDPEDHWDLSRCMKKGWLVLDDSSQKPSS